MRPEALRYPWGWVWGRGIVAAVGHYSRPGPPWASQREIRAPARTRSATQTPIPAQLTQAPLPPRGFSPGPARRGSLAGPGRGTRGRFPGPGTSASRARKSPGNSRRNGQRSAFTSRHPSAYAPDSFGTGGFPNKCGAVPRSGATKSAVTDRLALPRGVRPKGLESEEG